MVSLYNVGASTGNIIGPLLFNEKDAPMYFPGLRATLGIFVALGGVVLLQVFVLVGLNRRQVRRRVANGKMGVIRDLSMENEFDGSLVAEVGNEGEFDLTDAKNDEFVYIY